MSKSVFMLFTSVLLLVSIPTMTLADCNSGHFTTIDEAKKCCPNPNSLLLIQEKQQSIKIHAINDIPEKNTTLHAISQELKLPKSVTKNNYIKEASFYELGGWYGYYDPKTQHIHCYYKYTTKNRSDWIITMSNRG